MNNKFKLVTTASIGLIIFVITIAVFFLSTASPRETLDFYALTFAVISEIAFFGYLIYLVLSVATSSKRIIRTGVLSVIGIYWFVTVLLIFFRGAFAETPGSFFIINLILFGITAVLCILINVVSSYVGVIDEKAGNIDKHGKRGRY